jgi:hypothetical protein
MSWFALPVACASYMIQTAERQRNACLEANPDPDAGDTTNADTVSSYDPDLEDLQRKQADIAQCWVKYYLYLLETGRPDKRDELYAVGSISTLCLLIPTSGQRKRRLTFFLMLTWQLWRRQYHAKCLVATSKPRSALFKVSSSCLVAFHIIATFALTGTQRVKEAVAFYQLDGHTSDHVSCSTPLALRCAVSSFGVPCGLSLNSTLLCSSGQQQLLSALG